MKKISLKALKKKVIKKFWYDLGVLENLDIMYECYLFFLKTDLETNKLTKKNGVIIYKYVVDTINNSDIRSFISFIVEKFKVKNVKADLEDKGWIVYYEGGTL